MWLGFKLQMSGTQCGKIHYAHEQESQQASVRTQAEDQAI
jgi:hypothetical protein